MTREDKLWSMRMIDLEKVADKLGIKINKKAAKAKAIEKILAAENEWEDTPPEENNPPVETPPEPVKDTKPEPVDTPSEKKSPGRGAPLKFNGKTQNICAWAKELGISANTLYGRIYKMGWSVEKAFTTPPKKKNK